MLKRGVAARGFTLMETLLAIALVGALLSIYLTVFVPARGMVRQALTRQDAERIVGNLRAEMNTLRPGEIASEAAVTSSKGKYVSTFDKAFHMVQASAKPSTSYVIFSYRADTSQNPGNANYYPSTPASKSVPGSNCELVTAVGPMNDKRIQSCMKDAVNSVFLVKLTQLVDNGNGTFTALRKPGVIRNASSPEKYVSSEGEEETWGGVVFCRADFYLLSPPNPARYRRKTWDRMGKPIFSANVSFHR